MGLALLFASNSLAQRYNFRNFNVADGLGQAQVMTLCQDRRGGIWAGTYGGGACRFDGKAFTVSDSLGTPSTTPLRPSSTRSTSHSTPFPTRSDLLITPSATPFRPGQTRSTSQSTPLPTRSDKVGCADDDTSDQV